jgi:hypothetical protein
MWSPVQCNGLYQQLRNGSTTRSGKRWAIIYTRLQRRLMRGTGKRRHSSVRNNCTQRCPWVCMGFQKFRTAQNISNMCGQNWYTVHSTDRFRCLNRRRKSVTFDRRSLTLSYPAYVRNQCSRALQTDDKIGLTAQDVYNGKTCSFIIQSQPY